MTEPLGHALEVVLLVLNVKLFSLGDNAFTPWTVLSLVVLLWLLFKLAGTLRRWLVERMLVGRIPDGGARHAIGTIVQYAAVLIGFVIIIQAVGVDVGALSVAFGALGVGIGFGLQSITNNFVSGLVLLFERPVKVGDRIEVGELTGDVVSIAIRATTVVTNDNIAVIVPNSELVTGRVVNWSLTDRNVRIRVPIGVSYGSDPLLVRDLLVSICQDHPGILAEPKPEALFSGFGDSSLEFDLRVWTADYSNRPLVLISEINFRIFAAFKEHGIEIPFPQRDLHIKSGSSSVAGPPAREPDAQDPLRR